MKTCVLYLELGVMIHSWRLVILWRYNQLPLAKFLLGVRVGEFVPTICRGTQKGFKDITLMHFTTQSQTSVLINCNLIRKAI